MEDEDRKNVCPECGRPVQSTQQLFCKICRKEHGAGNDDDDGGPAISPKIPANTESSPEPNGITAVPDN